MSMITTVAYSILLEYFAVDPYILRYDRRTSDEIAQDLVTTWLHYPENSSIVAGVPVYQHISHAEVDYYIVRFVRDVRPEHRQTIAQYIDTWDLQKLIILPVVTGEIGFTNDLGWLGK